MSSNPIIVLKFGGSVLANMRSMQLAVHEIYRWRREGWRVVAVVSALAGHTESLLRRAAAFGRAPDPFAQSNLVALGELKSSALLGLMLDRFGQPATVLNPGSVNFRATGHALDSNPVSIDVAPLENALNHHGTVVFPGFIAIGDAGRTVTLGRGGSDLTAIVLADALKAERCRLVKDVDGLYKSNPNAPGPLPLRYEHATYQDAFATDGSIVQHKAIAFAESRGITFELGRLNGVRPTRIGMSHTITSKTPDKPVQLKVALLGLGTVGEGTFELLGQMPDAFQVTCACVKSLEKSRSRLLGNLPVSTDPVAISTGKVDVVIEAMGGIEPANAAIDAALASKKHVITANKAVLAVHGAKLQKAAQKYGVTLRFSASVGGGLPVLERVRAAPTKSVRGVVNGTANFVLESVREGQEFNEAVREAQRLGLAELDPSRDLDGRDSLDKLRVIGAALNLVFNEDTCTIKPISAALGHHVAQRWRHMADVSVSECRVEPRAVKEGDPFWELPNESNAVEIYRMSGEREVLKGKGAGRWPTSLSVVADVLELSRELSAQAQERKDV